jgi:cystathionine beta-lyase/cystathionine gamma-synthase
MSPAKRARLGITEGLLRVSAGIEEVEDIIADVEQAFETTTEKKFKEQEVECFI